MLYGYIIAASIILALLWGLSVVLRRHRMSLVNRFKDMPAAPKRVDCEYINPAIRATNEHFTSKKR